MAGRVTSGARGGKLARRDGDHANHLPSDLLAPDPTLPVLLHRQVFVRKFALLIVNVGIVWFLSHHLRRGAGSTR